MVLTVDGCGNCSSAARRYLDSMLHREPGTDIRQCRSPHYYIRGPLARLDIAYAAAANAASLKPLQAKAAINISALQAPECFCHLHSGLPPPLARPQRAAKLRSGSMVCGKKDWGDWPAWRDKKTNTMQNGGREALSFHATPAQRTMRIGLASAISGAAAATSATCTAAGAMEQSGRRGRPRQTWGMGCAAGAAGGDTKKCRPTGDEPGGRQHERRRRPV